MTKLVDRPHSALLVIDVQNGVVGHAYARDHILANVTAAIERARAAAVPVIWVQHNSDDLVAESEQWQLMLARDPAEPLVQKRYADAFEETELEAVLGRLGVGRVYLSGAQTDECIRSTLHGALVRGYDTLLVSDAHTTEDLSDYGAPTPELVIAHTNLYWGNHLAPGRTAGTVTSAELEFSQG